MKLGQENVVRSKEVMTRQLYAQTCRFRILALITHVIYFNIFTSEQQTTTYVSEREI